MVRLSTSRLLYRRLTLAYTLALTCLHCGTETSDSVDSGLQDVVLDDNANEETTDGDLGPVVCPPPGPYGHDVGSTLENFTFEDCEGNPVSLHSLCGANAGLVFNFYGWCTGCYRYLEEAAGLHEAYAEQGLSTLIVITEDPLEEPADLDYCQHIRDRFDLTMPVVIDPSTQLEAYGGADLALITNERAVVIFKRIGVTVASLTTRIEAELER